MPNQLLHVFRNTPQGREILLQSLYFAKRADVHPRIFIPRFRQFLLHFGDNAVTVTLDSEFLRSAETARRRAGELVEAYGFKSDFLIPDSFATGSAPEIPSNFRYMCFPRRIGDLSARSAPGYMDPKVRDIIANAHFPILVPSEVYKEWKSITVLFDGTAGCFKALQLGMTLADTTGFPLSLFTHAEDKTKEDYMEVLQENNYAVHMKKDKLNWLFFNVGKLADNLYAVPHDSLVVIGTTAKGILKKLIAGNKAEILQTALPNNQLFLGPNYVPYFSK